MSENKRRNFINRILSGGFALLSGSVLYPIFRFVNPPEVPEAKTQSVLAGNVNDFGPNSGKLFRFGNKPGILVRTDSGEFVALSAICTHLGCIVQHSKEKHGIWCACHGGLYDHFGNVLAGPPPRPLPRYTVTFKGDEIYASKSVAT